MLPTTPYGEYFKIYVTCGEQTGVIFFSEQMSTLLSEVTSIQFDWTFYTVPTQFSQLWTVYVSVGRHTVPAIHCLMTAKSKELYTAVLENIAIYVPQFLPSASMSDWEPAARNALREIYPQVKLYGCWFHYTQRIWAKIQKLGLVHAFRNNTDTRSFIKQLMTVPFMPGPLINPTGRFLQIPIIEHS